MTAGPPAVPTGPGRAAPSGPLLLALALVVLAPLALAGWLAGAAVLRLGVRRWQLAAAAATGTALAVIVIGPSRAASVLLSDVAALAHVPIPPGASWAVLASLSAVLLRGVGVAAVAVPAGVLLATIPVKAVAALDLVDPEEEQRRAGRAEARTRAKAARLVKRAGRNFEAPGLRNSLGVSLGGDLTSWQSGRYVVLPEYAARLPRLVLGRPGQGKSVYLARETYLAGAARRQSVILDGKGDSEFAAAVVAAYLAGWAVSPTGDSPPTVHLFPAEPLSVWTGSPAEQVNKLLGVWAWSLESQYYREVCVLALRLAVGQPGAPVTSMAELVARLDPQALARVWAGHVAEANLVKTLRDKLGDVQLRLANLAAAAGGLLDGTRSIGQADLTVVSLPTMANRGDSEALFRVLMADLGHWTAARKTARPAQVLVDEFSALDGGRDYAVDLLERGRGAGVPVVLSGQSYRSLGDEDQRDRLVSAADALVLFGSATPDELVRLAGTVLEAEAVYTLEAGVWTGRASVARRHRAKVDANTVRQLQVGEAVIVSRGRAARLLVLPAPKGGDQPCAAAPAGAVEARELPPPVQPRQGAPPAPRRPPGGLDPAGRSSVRRHRPPQAEENDPGNDREHQEEAS